MKYCSSPTVLVQRSNGNTYAPATKYGHDWEKGDIWDVSVGVGVASPSSLDCGKGDCAGT